MRLIYLIFVRLLNWFVLLARSATDSQGYFVLTGTPARGRYSFVVSTPKRDGNLAGEQAITLTVQ